MRLLDRFQDGAGNPMSKAWRTRERKPRKPRKAKVQAAAFADADVVIALKASLNSRAHPTINKFVRAHVNPMRADLKTIGLVTKPLGIVLNALSERPHTMRELTDIVGSQCGYSASNAQREAYSTVSILTASGRATHRGNLLELK